MFGFFVSIVVGAIVITITNKIAWRYAKDEKITKLSPFVGICERALYTLVFLLGIAGYLIPAWLILKTIGKWNYLTSEKGKDRTVYNIFLLSNALSIIFGIIGAWIIMGNAILVAFK